MDAVWIKMWVGDSHKRMSKKAISTFKLVGSIFLEKITFREYAPDKF